MAVMARMTYSQAGSNALEFKSELTIKNDAQWTCTVLLAPGGQHLGQELLHVR